MLPASNKGVPKPPLVFGRCDNQKIFDFVTESILHLGFQGHSLSKIVSKIFDPSGFDARFFEIAILMKAQLFATLFVFFKKCR